MDTFMFSTISPDIEELVKFNLKMIKKEELQKNNKILINNFFKFVKSGWDECDDYIDKFCLCPYDTPVCEEQYLDSC